MKSTDFAAGDKVRVIGAPGIRDGIKAVRADDAGQLYLWCPIAKNRYPLGNFLKGDYSQLEKVV